MVLQDSELTCTACQVSARHPSPKVVSSAIRCATTALPVELSASYWRGEGYHEPSRSERDALLIAFAMHREPLHGAGYDVVRLSRRVDLTDPHASTAATDAVTMREIKSINRAKLGSDLKGYFCNITSAELLTAQCLGEQYRFLFVDSETSEHQEISLGNLRARARATHPAWLIRS